MYKPVVNFLEDLDYMAYMFQYFTKSSEEGIMKAMEDLSTTFTQCALLLWTSYMSSLMDHKSEPHEDLPARIKVS